MFEERLNGIADCNESIMTIQAPQDCHHEDNFNRVGDNDDDQDRQTELHLTFLLNLLTQAVYIAKRSACKPLEKYGEGDMNKELTGNGTIISLHFPTSRLC